MHKQVTTQHIINLHKCNVLDMLLSDGGGGGGGWWNQLELNENQ